jgi:pyrophosphate-dependent phosphofructokinase (EC 2.7.1.90)
MTKPKKVAILTAGGLAPCLSSAIGSLIERYSEIDPTIEIICYRSGYKGLLLGDYYSVTPEIREKRRLATWFWWFTDR